MLLKEAETKNGATSFGFLDLTILHRPSVILIFVGTRFLGWDQMMLEKIGQFWAKIMW